MDEPILRTQSFQELKGLTVVIPCYKEDSEFLTKTYYELTQRGAEVFIVDDGSKMDLPIHVPVISYTPNMGYGYAIKRGIKEASQPYICTADGDGQHTIEDICKMYTVFKLIPNCAMLVGCRWNLNESFHRWFGRKCLNFLASCIAQHYLVDLNSGMRIFKTELAMGYRPILCDTFSFTTSLTMSVVTDGHKIAWFPIDVKPRLKGNSNVKVIRDGLTTLWYILWIGIALRTRNFRKWLREFL